MAVTSTTVGVFGGIASVVGRAIDLYRSNMKIPAIKHVMTSNVRERSRRKKGTGRLGEKYGAGLEGFLCDGSNCIAR